MIDAKISDFVLSRAHARYHGAVSIVRQYRHIEGNEDEQRKQIAAASKYYYSLAAAGDISEATAEAWTGYTVRFGIVLARLRIDRAEDVRGRVTP